MVYFGFRLADFGAGSTHREENEVKTGLLASLAVVGLSGVAQGSVISETFTGTIASGVDVLDLFGAAISPGMS
jgi:hypothetical protein